jgi:hypothetical protein
MSQGASAAEKPATRPAIATLLGGLRFIATDRISIIILAWAAIAFWLRPLLLDAHHGVPGGIYADLRGKFGTEALARLSAVTQWASFAGLIAIGVMAHVRAAMAGQLKGSLAINLALAAGYVALMFGGYVFFLWGPESVFTLITHDSLIFFDSTYRIDHGQVPSTDFPTAIGAAALYLPWLGAKIAGGYAGSVEMASAIVALLLGLVVAQAGASRLPVGVTAALAGVVFLVTVPATLLEHWGSESLTLIDGKAEILADDLTWSMFYNRWGWAAMIPLFLFLAPRKDDSPPKIAEIVSFGAVLTFLFYLKMTYFGVGVIAAACWAFTNSKHYRTLAIGVGATLGLTLLIGLITGNLFAYLRDASFVGKVSGTRTDFILPIIRKNLQELLLAGAPLAIIAATGKATWKDVLITAVIVLGSLFIINQNGQLSNIVALVAIGGYGVARVWSMDGAGKMARFASMGVFLLLAAGTLLDRGMMLIDQAYAARREENRLPTPWSDIPAFKGVYIAERESFFTRAERAITPDDRRKLVRMSGELGRREDLRQGEYMETILSGIADLKPVVKPGDSIVTLDMANPFSFMMDARDARGALLTMHRDRSISEKLHPKPEDIFADADHVMIAKASMVQPTAELVLKLYDPWLTSHYVERVESAFWIRYSRKKPAA